MEFQVGKKTINSDKILNCILDENYTDSFVVAYSSSIDGVGNGKSDIDIYIVTQNKKGNENHAIIRNFVIDEIDLDAEYWNLEALVAQLNSVKTNLSAEYLKTVLSRITIGGSIFLAAIAVFPDLMSKIPIFAPFRGTNNSLVYLMGGTSVMISVSVAVELLKQIESYLQMHNYDGILKKSKVRR